MNFLKSLGLGLVIIILLPVLLLGATLIGVVMLFEWVIVFIKGTIRFFKGDTFFKPLPEDIIVEQIKANELERQTKPNPEPAPAPQPTQQNVYVTNYYQYPNQAQPAPQPIPQPIPQPTPAQNPYLNNSPIPEAIPGNAQGAIQGNYQEIPYQQKEQNDEASAFDITEEEGGIEQ